MPFHFNDQFIGFAPNTVKEFHSSDDPDRYRENLKKYKNQYWEWKDKKIEYIHNRRGHRCKDIEDIDLDNYILFLGCSHTEGIGLPVEETYSYLTAKKLKKDYYNLALAGSGNDITEYNLIAWIETIPKKPDFIVLQYSAPERYSSVIPADPWPGKELIKKDLTPRSVWDTDKTSRKLLDKLTEHKLDEAKLQYLVNLANNIADCPVVIGSVIEKRDGWPVPDNNNEVLIFAMEDQARDKSPGTSGHSGKKSNEMWSDKIIKYISDLK